MKKILTHGVQYSTPPLNVLGRQSTSLVLSKLSNIFEFILYELFSKIENVSDSKMEDHSTETEDQSTAMEDQSTKYRKSRSKMDDQSTETEDQKINHKISKSNKMKEGI